MNNFWQFVNRPVVILILALALWPLASAWQRRMAVHSTVRAFVDEIQNDRPGGGPPLKQLGSSITSQFVAGLTSFTDRMGKDQAAKLAAYNSAASQVALADVKTAAARSPNREKIIGTLKNGSSTAISQVHLNFMIYGQDGGLIDVEDKTIFEVKLVQAGQTIGFSMERDLGDQKEDKTVLEGRKATKVVAQVVSFEVPDLGEKKPN